MTTFHRKFGPYVLSVEGETTIATLLESSPRYSTLRSIHFASIGPVVRIKTSSCKRLNYLVSERHDFNARGVPAASPLVRAARRVQKESLSEQEC
jgi:hypothetical protein